jgi:hypothetical protein
MKVYYFFITLGLCFLHSLTLLHFFILSPGELIILHNIHVHSSLTEYRACPLFQFLLAFLATTLISIMSRVFSRISCLLNFFLVHNVTIYHLENAFVCFSLLRFLLHFTVFCAMISWINLFLL